MISLPEFLDARIAEDEARWRRAEAPWSAPHDPDCDYPGDMPGICTCDLLDRLLVECAAKLRIVEWAPVELGIGHAYGVFRFLALPYADHPDYDEEWRP